CGIFTLQGRAAGYFCGGVFGANEFGEGVCTRDAGGAAPGGTAWHFVDGSCEEGRERGDGGVSAEAAGAGEGAGEGEGEERGPEREGEAAEGGVRIESLSHR